LTGKLEKNVISGTGGAAMESLCSLIQVFAVHNLFGAFFKQLREKKDFID